MEALDSLIYKISRLPRLGPKSARRIAYHLLKNDAEFNKTLGEAIINIKDKVHPCPVCGIYTEHDICSICNDSSRNREFLCIVEETQDVNVIEDSGVYKGLYHVLGGAISILDGIYPENLRFKELDKRIAEGQFTEIIIATNPTDQGDTTAAYIKKLLSKYPNLHFSRIAQGLQAGGDIEFANHRALYQSFKNRLSF